MAPTEYNETHFRRARAASTISLLAGVWLFLSPWIYGAYVLQNAWNAWIVGALIAVFAAIRVSNPARIAGLSWVNLMLGLWTFASPWLYGYTANSGRFVNSLFVGVIVAVASVTSMTATSDSPAAHRA